MLKEEKNKLTGEEILEHVKTMINEECTRYLDIIEDMSKSLDARLGQFEDKVNGMTVALSHYFIVVQQDVGVLESQFNQLKWFVEKSFNGDKEDGDD